MNFAIPKRKEYSNHIYTCNTKACSCRIYSWNWMIFVGTVNEKSVSLNLKGNMEKKPREEGEEEKVDMGNAVITLRT